MNRTFTHYQIVPQSSGTTGVKFNATQQRALAQGTCAQIKKLSEWSREVLSL